MRHAAITASLLIAALAVTPGAGSAQGPAVRLGPGDAIRLEVYPDRGALPTPALDGVEPRDYQVDENGTVLLPVAGLVRVGGRDFAEVRAEVEGAFAAEYRGALVRLVPLLRISVLGEVRVPGLVPVDPTMSLSDVLAAAGGLTELADQGGIRHIRRGEVVSISSARDVVQRTDPLVSGDQIVVGRRSWISQNAPWLIGAGASVTAAVLTALLVR